jgi:hypothetical protein
LEPDSELLDAWKYLVLSLDPRIDIRTYLNEATGRSAL